mgnify:CR=1 FL=1
MKTHLTTRIVSSDDHNITFATIQDHLYDVAIDQVLKISVLARTVKVRVVDILLDEISTYGYSITRTIVVFLEK